MVSFCTYASPLSETVGAESTTNPFSAKIFYQGPEVAYFNPALLTMVRQSVTLNTFYMYQNFHITLFDRDPSNDIVGDVNNNTGVYGAQRVGKDGITHNLAYKPLPTASLQPRGGNDPARGHFYGALGGVLQIIPERLAAGVYAVLPIGTMQDQQSRFADEKEASFSNSLYYELYDDRMMTNNVAIALSGGITKWLHIGAGVTLVTESQVNTLIYTPDASKAENQIQAQSSIGTTFMPHFGLFVRPWWKLELTATAHLAIQNNIDSTNVIKFFYITKEKEKEINTNVLKVAHAYQPLTISLGAALAKLELGELKTDVGFTITYKRWSQYLNRYYMHPEENVVWSDDAVNKDGNTGDWVTETNSSMKWLDTIDFTVGTAMEYKNNKMGLDFAYYQTPVPDQTGRTNYVDNSKIMIGGGYSHLWKIKSFEFETGLNFQCQILLERTTNKTPGVAGTAQNPSNGQNNTVIDEFPESVGDLNGQPLPESDGFQTNNPGYPGYKSGGQIYSAGLWITLYFDGGIKNEKK